MLEAVRPRVAGLLADTADAPPDGQELVVAPAFARAGLVGALALALNAG
jgi:hypothetical protein